MMAAPNINTKRHSAYDPSLWEYYLNVGNNLEENFCMDFYNKIESTTTAKKIEKRRLRNMMTTI